MQHDNPGDACQVLLICAVQLNYSGQASQALIMLQKALDLAKSSRLTDAIPWVIWGECAICVQLGDYELADIHFRHLQTALHDQNDWMLADYIDVVRQFFSDPGGGGTEIFPDIMKNKELKPLLTSTFDWLSHWGFPAQTANNHSKTPIDQSLPSPQGPWHTLKLIFSGELKFHWQGDFLHPKNHSPLWGSILSLLRLNFVGQSTDSPTINAIPHPTYSLPQQGEKEADKATDLIITPKQEEEVPPESINRTQQLEPAIITIPVSVYLLGKFEMKIQDVACELPASRSLSLLKYLLVHHKQSIPREVLMDVFWPETAPDTARNNLNVAMHNLRKALRFAIFIPVIVYENGVYKWDPNVQIWVDVEEFEKCIKSGQRFEAHDQLKAAVGQYEAAVSLYQGDFLEQNPYEEWTIHDRERLRAAYLDAIERLCQIYFGQENYVACISVCQRILSFDPCREDAYCLLMRCYSRQGQDHLALRQYQNCVKALRAELDVDPAPETTKLYNRIRRREQV